ncbi:MAG: DUF1080 domain-containing protein, partial [Gemmataceae bacterium]
MKTRTCLLGGLAMLLVTTARSADDKGNVPPDGFKALFNGKDLNNWRGQIAEDPRDIAKITKGFS